MSSVFVKVNSNNLDNLPGERAVYAFWAESKEKSQPVNCRYVGQTDDLERRIKEHFSDSSHNDCLKKFLDSNKTKILEYELMPGSSEDENLKAEQEWIDSRNPKCNK